MEKIESFTFAVDYLKQQEVLCSVDNQKLTYYRMKGNMISVNMPNAHYLLSLEQFKELFSRQTFYLYTKYEDSIDLSKDEEYYSWKNKPTN